MSKPTIEGLAFLPQQHVSSCGEVFPPTSLTAHRANTAAEKHFAHPFFTVMRNGFKSIQADYDIFKRVLVDDTVGSLPVDAVDPVSGCRSIHFVAKMGGRSEQDDEAAARLIAELIRLGADTNRPCEQRGMSPLQYAAYFNSPKVVDLLLHSISSSGQINVNAICEKWSDFTALHFAVQGSSVACVETLLAARANPELHALDGKRPLDLARSILANLGDFDSRPAQERIIALLEKETGKFVAFEPPKAPLDVPPPVSTISVPRLMSEEVSDTSSMVSSLPDDDVINVGDRVDVKGKGAGLVRFKGQTKFKAGIWYGIQLDNPYGKNNGTVAMVTYFKTKPKHGVMVRRSRLTKLDHASHSPEITHRNRKAPPTKSGKRPAPFTAPTFRTQKGVRPDAGVAKSPSKYTYMQRAQAEAGAKGGSKLRPSGSLRGTRAKSPSTRSPASSGPQSPSDGLQNAPKPVAAKRPAASSIRREKPLSPSIQERAQSLKATPRSNTQRPEVTSAPFSPLSEPFGLRSRVLTGGNVGSVQYIGPKTDGSGKPGVTYVGVGFSKRVDGGTDGEFDGVRYFTVPEGTGKLVPASRVFWHGHRVDHVLEE